MTATPPSAGPAIPSAPHAPSGSTPPPVPSLDPAEPRPVTFPEANILYHAPAGLGAPGGDLPCYRAAGTAVSCWYFPSWRDRVAFLLTGRLWLYLLAPAHPPAALATRSPFPPRS